MRRGLAVTLCHMILIGLIALCLACSDQEADGSEPGANTASAIHLINPWQIDGLEKQGLADPVPTLVKDLQAHPELIPYEGVLGGTMRFGSPEHIHVLNDRWVYAYFEDGHILGWGLFRYTVVDSDSVAWEVLEAFLE